MEQTASLVIQSCRVLVATKQCNRCKIFLPESLPAMPDLVSSVHVSVYLYICVLVPVPVTARLGYGRGHDVM